MYKLGINNVNCENKRILLRADLDCEVRFGKIQNRHKVKTACESIQYALNHDCKSVVVISHMGEPEGMRNVQLTLAPFAEAMSEILKQEVIFIDNCMGLEAEEACYNPSPGTVILLENLRFHIEEQGSSKDGKTKADPAKVKKFRERLRRLADVYVNDAFGLCNLEHSSLTGDFFPVRVAGIHMRRELAFFQVMLEEPDRPAVAIFGGDKLGPRAASILRLMNAIDEVVIGGRMSVTFLAVNQSMPIGSTPWDAEGAAHVDSLMAKIAEKNLTMYFPVDFLCGDENTDFDHPPDIFRVEDGIEEPYQMNDIGPDTITYFSEVILRAATLIWDGEMGDVSNAIFSKGTREINNAIVAQTKYGAVSVVCGESAFAICDRFNSVEGFSHVSTGGNIPYTLMAGDPLPAYDALSDLEQPCLCQVNKQPSMEIEPEF